MGSASTAYPKFVAASVGPTSADDPPRNSMVRTDGASRLPTRREGDNTADQPRKPPLIGGKGGPPAHSNSGQMMMARKDFKPEPSLDFPARADDVPVAAVPSP